MESAAILIDLLIVCLPLFTGLLGMAKMWFERRDSESHWRTKVGTIAAFLVFSLMQWAIHGTQVRRWEEMSGSYKLSLHRCMLKSGLTISLQPDGRYIVSDAHERIDSGTWRVYESNFQDYIQFDWEGQSQIIDDRNSTFALKSDGCYYPR